MFKSGFEQTLKGTSDIKMIQCDKMDLDEFPEELSLSVRKISIQSEEFEHLNGDSHFNTPSKFSSYETYSSQLNPIKFVEDAGTEASMDEESYHCEMVDTPKFEKANWLGSLKKKQTVKKIVSKRSKAIDKQVDKKSLAK